MCINIDSRGPWGQLYNLLGNNIEILYYNILKIEYLIMKSVQPEVNNIFKLKIPDRDNFKLIHNNVY